MYNIVIKRLLDVIFALLGLLVLSPVFLILIVLLFFVNKGKPFFIQPRPGKNDLIFKLVKFKTMTDKRDSKGNLLPDELRLNKMGKLIRNTSLDELPQLFNVLKGDMSFVGPRPLLVEYLPLYNEKQKRRNTVKPGITGWAQVNGRNSILWEEKFNFDIWYIDNISFYIDFKIILMTIKNVIRRKDISKSGFETTDAFNGRN